MEKLNESKVDIENGIFNSLWSGYFLSILDEENEEILNINITMGTTHINCPVKIQILNGDIYQYFPKN